MNKKLLIFNWKSAPATVGAAIKLARTTENYSKSSRVDIVIAPPFLFTEEVGKFIKKAKLGSQDVFWSASGRTPADKISYTGEISLRQEKNLKVKHVIIGHSERRRLLKETDAMINKKVLATLKAGLKVILCVGEPARASAPLKNAEQTQNYAETKIRIKNLKSAKDYVKNQLQKDLKGITLNSKSYILNSQLIIAYEPVWAIGTNHPDSPEDAVEMIKFIKQTLNSKFHAYRQTGKILNSKILYGGSVNSKNIKIFVKYKEINGFLIGGASLKPKEIKNIIKAI